jgi:hypothetical protein
MKNIKWEMENAFALCPFAPLPLCVETFSFSIYSITSSAFHYLVLNFIKLPL